MQKGGNFETTNKYNYLYTSKENDLLVRETDGLVFIMETDTFVKLANELLKEKKNAKV